MNTALWTYVAMRALICAAAGETAIRYVGWLALIKMNNKKYAATPLIGVLAGIGFWRANIEGHWLLLLLNKRTAATFTAIDGGDWHSQISRFGVLTFFCAATYVVTKLQYEDSLTYATVNFVARLFTITVALIAGSVASTVYYFHQ